MFVRPLQLLGVSTLLALALVLSNARAAGGGAGAELRYVVKQGDTLWSIAGDRYGGDLRGGVWRVQERNGLTSAALTPGTVLFLPP
jgi:nucleoid-associated protein YgaU